MPQPSLRGPIADTVYALMTDWSLVALQRDKSEMWEKRYLMGPNLKRFKEKPLTKAFAAVSPRHPVIYFVRSSCATLCPFFERWASCLISSCMHLS